MKAATRAAALVAEEGEEGRGPVRRRDQGRGPGRLAVRVRRLGKVNARVLKGEFRQLWPAHMILLNTDLFNQLFVQYNC